MRIKLARLAAAVVVVLFVVLTLTAFRRRTPHRVPNAEGLFNIRNLNLASEQNWGTTRLSEESTLAGPAAATYTRKPVRSDCAQSSPQDCQEIHVAISCIGNNETQAAALLVKSILMYRRNPLHFHLRVDRMAGSTLKELFRTWKLTGVQQTYYEVKRRANGAIAVNAANGQFAANSSPGPTVTDEREPAENDWLLELFPSSVSKVIALDSRRIFCTDIYELWSFFVHFDDTQALGAVTQLGSLKPGVLLVDLSKFRALAGYRPKDGPAVPAGLEVSSNDGVHLLSQSPKQLLFNLPCGWNFPSADAPDSCVQQESEVKVMEAPTTWLPHRYWQLFLKVVNFDGNMLRQPLAHTCFPSDIRSSGSAAGTWATSPQFQLVEVHGDSLCREYMREVIDLFRTHTYYLNYEYEPPNDELDVTLVTQLSISRIQGFEGLCDKWPGPISVAVYLTDSNVRHFISYVLGSKVLSKRKNIGYHLVFEEGSLYPTNHLRNVAVKQVKTTHVFLLDVDFMPQPDLYNILRRALHHPQLTARKLALLVPAFETLDYRFKFPQTKAEAVTLYDSGAIFGFRLNIFAKGHAATNFSRWRNSNEPYEIKWEDGFEPYIVMRTDTVPLYNEIFMGYGKDKISQIMEVAAMGHDYLVLPDTYIIHLPHAVSFDSQRFRGDASILKCMSLLLDDYTRGLLRKYGANSLGGWTPRPLRVAAAAPSRHR